MGPKDKLTLQLATVTEPGMQTYLTLRIERAGFRLRRHARLGTRYPNYTDRELDIRHDVRPPGQSHCGSRLPRQHHGHGKATASAQLAGSTVADTGLHMDGHT